MTLDEALELCAKDSLSTSEVQELCAQFGGTERHPLDALALAVARRYMGGGATFEAADTLMNSIWAHSVETDNITSLMYSIYDAFDAGEYHHREDPEGTDSEERYTRPALTEILASVGAA